MTALAAIIQTDQARKAAVLTAAVAAHVVILSALALRVIEAPPLIAPPPAPLFIDIEPRPLLPGERPRPRPSPPVVVTEVAPGGGAVTGVVVRPAPSPLDEEEERRRLAAEAAARSGVDPAWAVRPDTETDAQRAARALRTAGFGCHPATRRLTAAEQASCDRRLAQAAAEAGRITGTADPARDAALAAQGRRALAQYDARRAPLSGRAGVSGPAECPGANLGMGCPGAHLPDVPGVDMRQQGDSLVRQPSNKLD